MENLIIQALNISYTFKITCSISDFKEEWSSVMHDNLYLKYTYLKAVENSRLSNVYFWYVIVYKKEKPIGLLYFQKIKFSNDVYKQEKINQIITRKFIGFYNEVLLLGNLFTPGLNGFVFDDEIDEKTINIVINEVSTVIKKVCKCDFLIIKELYENQYSNLQSEIKQKFILLNIDVNMELVLNQNWNNFDDYLMSMTTKYRTRAKNVYKKTKDVVVKEFSAKEIKEYSQEIEKLYVSVVQKAKFNLISLTKNSFYEMKKSLQNDFIFKGYFLNHTMIAFSSAYVGNNSLDANYVGVNYDINKEIPLYQRVLYDYVDLSINTNVSKLRLGRTAELIKSSLGAKPIKMFIYIHHKNKIINTAIKPIIKKIEPTVFEVRNPFKKL